MKAMVKGLELMVTVGVSVKCELYDGVYFRKNEGKTYERDRNEETHLKNLDLNGSVQIKTGCELYEGEVDFKEIIEGIKMATSDSIKQQIQQQLKEQSDTNQLHNEVQKSITKKVD